MAFNEVSVLRALCCGSAVGIVTVLYLYYPTGRSARSFAQRLDTQPLSTAVVRCTLRPKHIHLLVRPGTPAVDAIAVGHVVHSRVCLLDSLSATTR